MLYETLKHCGSSLKFYNNKYERTLINYQTSKVDDLLSTFKKVNGLRHASGPVLTHCRTDAIILTVLLRTILTVTTVWNTGETGDIYRRLLRYKQLGG